MVGSNLRPRDPSQMFSLSHDQDVEENESFIVGMFLLCGIPAYFLIDTGASHYFIYACFFKRHKLPYIALDVVISVSTPTGQSAFAKHLVLGCPLEFKGNVLTAILVVVGMKYFYRILGFDMLTIPSYSGMLPETCAVHPVGDDSCVGIGYFPFVNEFLDVFPDEIPCFPPVREFEFRIELMSGTSPISRVLYRQASSEMREMKQQLQDIL
ncbi:uncharacterized protein [Henckelia pumila]|uniref:uncharacterized protein n=1 Tax=Henckelia pumila TaxID=405737 RepID=UPI003C6E5139